ncbi:prolyl oligopeptidase family serine peptidase [Flavobacterium sp. T12S277]|uniref:S9 family peptidase n=1 Tax=Flavobacterium sp. T12S277 TaxID=3402752 RepID=UPI003ADEE9C0
MILKSKIFSIGILLIVAAMNAQNNTETVRGNPELPSSKTELQKITAFDKGSFKYQVEDYFANPKASAFKISPDGKFLSYKERDKDGKNHIYVKNLKTEKVSRVIEEKDELIHSYDWFDNEHLYFFKDKGGDENMHVNVADIKNGTVKDITPFDGVKVSHFEMLKDSDYVIVVMNKNNKQINEPFKINYKTGELTLLMENKDLKDPISSYIFDRDGNIRGYYKLKDGVVDQLYYKDLDSNKFNLVKETDWKSNFNIIKFNYNSANKDEVYVSTNLNSDKTRIVLYDLKKNSIIKEIYSNPIFDLSEMGIGGKKRNYELDFVGYEGIKHEIIPISKFYTKMYNNLKKEFSDKEFSVVSHDKNEKTFLILVNSDKLFGRYYTYDVATTKIKLLYDLMPQLKEEDMAEMRPIQFTSRDGLTIYGYITLPKSALNGEKVPLIVNPHGGPQGIRDTWGYNKEAQLFASRGYATLQVNFRISGGYGKKFQEIGYKQIGRKVMDDVEDGVKYVIEQGWVDKGKIAIYGGSHGGYATLMGLIKTPDLYVCGVDYVGVSNIFTFFDSFPEYWKPLREQVKEIWYNLDDPEEAKIAKEVSPVFQTDKIKKPLFVVQGANDPRVNINESDQIVKALRSKGFETPYMVKYDEGHGFKKEKNRIELYKCMLGFFAENFNK